MSVTDRVKSFFERNGVCSIDDLVSGMPLEEPLEIEAVVYALEGTGYLKTNEDGDYYPVAVQPFGPDEMAALAKEGFNAEFIRVYCDRHGVDVYEAMDANRQYRSFVNQEWRGETY